MFKFIKKFFKEEKLIETIDLANIDAWFDNKSNVVFYKLNSEVTTFNIRIKSVVIKLKRELENLKNAKLKNPNIQQRMIDIMSGNRESYIRKNQTFLDSLNLPKDYTDVDLFLDETESSLENLHNSTQKSYTVLNEFFEHEAYKVASNVKKVDLLVKELKNTLNKYSLRKINQLQRDIANLKLKIGLEKEIKEKIKKVEEYSNDLNKLKEKAIIDIEDFKKTSEYGEFNKLKQDKELLLKKEEKNNSEIIHFFSVIQHPLKKYSRLTLDENLIQLYLKNPIKALNSDPNLKIMDILKKMKASIELKKVQLKNSKKERTIQHIQKVDIKFFNNFIEKYNELRERVKNKDKEIRECKSIDKIKELQDKSNKTKENIKRLNDNLDSLNKEYNKINVDALKMELQSDLSSTFEGDIRIG